MKISIGNTVTAPSCADGIANAEGLVLTSDGAAVPFREHLRPTVEQHGSMLYTAEDLAALNPHGIRTQSIDYDSVLNHLREEMDCLVSDGLVKTHLATDLLSITYSENIVTPYECPDIKVVAKRVKKFILVALVEEEFPCCRWMTS